jgi:hypothetical protein
MRHRARAAAMAERAAMQAVTHGTITSPGHGARYHRVVIGPARQQSATEQRGTGAINSHSVSGPDWP